MKAVGSMMLIWELGRGGDTFSICSAGAWGALFFLLLAGAIGGFLSRR